MEQFYTTRAGQITPRNLPKNPPDTFGASAIKVHTRGRGVASQFRLRDVRAWLKVREAKAKAAEKAKVREAKAAEKAKKTAKQ